MASVVISLLVAERLHPDSIYTLKLSRRGIRLRRGRDLDVMETVHVDEVMVRQPFCVMMDLPVSALAGEFIRTGRHGFPVLNQDGKLYGVVSLEDYRRAIGENSSPATGLLVRDIATRGVVTVFPDESVGEAMRRMAPRDLSRLPVVDREDPRRLIGVVRRNDIIRAYEVGALKREEARRRSTVALPPGGEPAEFVDFPLSPGSAAIGKRISELSLPKEVVLVSVRRGRELIIPHGDTRLEEHDVITMLCKGTLLSEMRLALESSGEEKP
jgi:CIC family chloride channel protein